MLLKPSDTTSTANPTPSLWAQTAHVIEVTVSGSAAKYTRVHMHFYSITQGTYALVKHRVWMICTMKSMVHSAIGVANGIEYINELAELICLSLLRITVDACDNIQIQIILL